jgi:hypothetical protein
MKYSKWLLAGMMILPWIAVPLLDRNSIKRFLPATLFICLFVRLESILARKRRWWWFYEKLHPRLMGVTPFILGPFFVGTLWILRLTYGKFLLYMVSNHIVHLIFVYPLVTWLKQSGILSLVRLKRLQLLLIFTFKAVLLYGFQYLKEKVQGEGTEETE